MPTSGWNSTAARVSVALVGLCLAPACAAQEPPKPLETPRLTQAAKTGWFRTGIIQGQISVRGARFGSMANESKGTGANEKLAIRAAGAAPSISYTLSAPDREYALEVSAGDHVEIRQTPTDGSTLDRVEFHQTGGQGVSLTVASKEDQATYTGASLWHLLISRPEVCRRHLLPLLEPITPQHDLAAMAGQIEAALIEAGAAGNQADRDRWAELVEQLGDQRYSKRESADRRLREAGPLVVTFLGRLDRSKLDAEQQYRIHRIIQALSDQSGDDTPELVASWLAGDPAIWLALLSRDKESTRRLASEQLQTLLAKPIEFDPTADPEIRKDQIEELRRRITKE